MAPPASVVGAWETCTSTYACAPHEHFDRRGYDLVHELHVPFTQAALGTTVAFETLDGVEDLTIARGTQNGQVIKLKGRGVPHVEGRGRGDLLVHVTVDVPTEARSGRRGTASRARLVARGRGHSGRGRFVLPHSVRVQITVHPPVSSPPASAPLVFVDDLEQPLLTPDDHHHLQRVLRVRAGESITISDGQGRWRGARFGDTVTVDGPLCEAPLSAPPLTLAFALVKGGRPELVTQKLTELGIDHIVPFVAERSVVRWEPGRDRRHVERLRRVGTRGGDAEP